MVLAEAIAAGHADRRQPALVRSPRCSPAGRGDLRAGRLDRAGARSLEKGRSPVPRPSASPDAPSSSRRYSLEAAAERLDAAYARALG